MRTMLLTILLFIAGLSFSFAQTLIDNFDSSAVNDLYDLSIEGNSILQISDDHSDFVEGNG